MKKVTYYYGENGKLIRKHNGEPRSIEAFLKSSEEATRIDMSTFLDNGYFNKSFTIQDGRWVGELFTTAEGLVKREVLELNKTVRRITEEVSREEADAIISIDADRVLPYAREAIRWCKDEDKSDRDGRYWLNAYAGADTYRLIVVDGVIAGSIPGGMHGSKRVRCSYEAWEKALHTAIEERVSGEYHLLKADGSGTYFYLRNEEDAQYLSVKKYSVPAVDGSEHLNVEVK